MSKNNQQAFTILELMIATVVFSVILLLVTSGIIKIGNAYYKSVLQSRTQETARNIIDEISRGIQFSGVAVVTTRSYNVDPPYASAVAGSRYGFCVNDVGYAYIMDKQLANPVTIPGEQRARTLMSYNTSCATFGTVANPVPAPGAVIGKELLGVGMRLTDLSVDDNGDADPSTFKIVVGVASGEFDLFEDNYIKLNGSVGTDGLRDTCKGGAGSQYCAVSKLSTIVQKRVE